MRTSKNLSLLEQESPKAVAFGQRLKGRQRSGKAKWDGWHGGGGAGQLEAGDLV